ncbi:hypothetical protein Q7P37_002091 [Cladosporium fusiforme]
MATPPLLPPPGQLWYNSPAYWDVVIVLSKYDEDLRIHAHKIVLAAASQVFDNWFKARPQDTELRISDILEANYLYVGGDSIEPEIFEMVLEHIYGISHRRLLTYEVGQLCRAAEGLGITDLCESAAQELEVRFDSLVPEDDKELREFCTALEDILFDPEFGFGEEKKWCTATKLVAKTCCSLYKWLDLTAGFYSLIERHPFLQRAMLNHIHSRCGGMAI